MSAHRITYEVRETVAGVRYRAACRCGARRDSRSHEALSAWGPEHVVSAWELDEQRRSARRAVAVRA